MTDEAKVADKEWDQVSKDRESQTRASDESVVVPEAEKEATVVAAVESDPLAGLPESTRNLIKGLEDRITTFDRQLGTANGTIGGLKQKLDESLAKLHKITPTVEAVAAEKAVQAKAEAEVKAKSKEEHRAKAREKLGDFLEPEELDVLLPADAEPAEVKAEPVNTESSKVLPEEERRTLILERELSDLVPGWMKTRDTAEFQAWMRGPGAGFLPIIQHSMDVNESASVFKAFEKHKSDAAQVAKVEKDRQERLRRGESIQGRGSSTGDVDTGPDALWNQVTRDREKARASG